MSYREIQRVIIHICDACGVEERGPGSNCGYDRPTDWHTVKLAATSYSCCGPCYSVINDTVERLLIFAKQQRLRGIPKLLRKETAA